MSRYHKKSVVIEAHRLGDDGWPDAIWEGVNQRQIILHLGRDAAKRVTGHADIHTMEGTRRAEIGDYIIRGVKGEFYPCKPDIFAATYSPEPVAPAPAGFVKYETHAFAVRQAEEYLAERDQLRAEVVTLRAVLTDLAKTHCVCGWGNGWRSVCKIHEVLEKGGRRGK